MTAERKFEFAPFRDWSAGYEVRIDGRLIGKVRKHFPTWERRTKGLRYVNARGTCKHPVWRATTPAGAKVGYHHRTRAAAVEALVRADQEAQP